MLRAIFSFFGAIFSFLTIGAVLGVLIIGAVFWMYGRDLPNHEQLAQYAPPTISRVYSSEGALIDEFAEERRLFAPSSEIPDLVKEAFISAEDKNFYHHKGYDPLGMIKAGLDAAQGKRLRGASTITQQVMKNFLLSSDRSAERKIKELILAARLEETMSKDKILELYLNEIYLGQNSYGVAAAAQTYFNKKLSDLTPGEVAYLAALPQRPSTLHPVRDYDDAVGRRNYVLREMRENGYITDAEADEAIAQPLKTVQSGDIPGFRQSLPPRGYFTDEVRRQLSRDFGETQFFTGGLSVRSTLDPQMQTAAEKALREGLENYDRSFGNWRGTGVTLEPDQLADEATWRKALFDVPNEKAPRDIEGWVPAVVLSVEGGAAQLGIENEPRDPETQVITSADLGWVRKTSNPGDLLAVGDVVLVKKLLNKDGSLDRWSLRQVPMLQGAFMAMDVNTGRVLAMQGGFSYQDSVFNRATQATRQPGSSFKPFVYASALDSGYTPATIVIDAPIEFPNGDGTMWRPQNASNKYYGPTPLRTGIERSRNVMTVRLANEVGMPVVAQYAERFGVYDHMATHLANALGSEETTLFRLVSAYAMFANGGERVEPSLVDRVQDRFGRTTYRHDDRDCVDCEVSYVPPGTSPRIVSHRERIMDPITAYQLTSMMRGVVDRGTASRYVNLPVPIAGKTGTTNDAKDVWFIGFSSNIVAGCFMGYDTPRSIPHGSGGGMCGPVFNEFMKDAIKKYGGGPFRVPPGGHFINIDRVTGARLSADASGANVVAEYFRDGVDPIFGLAAAIDGGFAMGEGLPMYSRDEALATSTDEVMTSTGERKSVPKAASFGTISAGGLY
ncbi:penicillin-binding protein 1A [Poseidonocella sp. HB161398]|uniref:penicillin-binding protein 1A n=1 Tax=Poseidonocella sp. HB161398 TaxID=2320855 RepID=UPI001109B3A3|nr:penicillin-binding protein 1A [Poseidonocella sp. HB161398]